MRVNATMRKVWTLLFFMLRGMKIYKRDRKQWKIIGERERESE